MRRIAITLTVLALVAGSFGCSSDAPTPPKSGPPTGPGPSGSSALQIRLFTSNPNPPAGTCTLIQAVVTLNGASVPDGTSVSFSTDYGVFAQNGLPLISVVTQNGAAVTALCSEFPGTAVVRATSTIGSETGSATITIQFQPAASGAGPFVSFCDPSFGPSTGGTALAIRGGRFCGGRACSGTEAGTTRVAFIVNGVLREATVVSVNEDTINVLTPGFPEVTSPTTPVEIRVTLNNNTATPTVLTLPNCFAFGTTLSTTPTITAVLPASGTNEGETRVTIIGSGFRAPVQVFFGEVEATIVSVAFNQIVVLTPPAFGAGRDNRNAQVNVRVRDVTSGLEANLEGGYRYVQPVQIIAMTNNLQRVDEPFVPVTIFGHGFQAPVAVELANWAATVISVSESEIVVLPGRPIIRGCTDITGPVEVTNINTGDSASALSFTYLVEITRPTITGVSPRTGPPGTVVTITGFNFPTSLAEAQVEFGGRLATVTSATPTQLVVVAPDQGQTAPLCGPGVAVGTPTNVGTAFSISVTNRFTTCTHSLANAFQYQLPCVAPTPLPTNTPSTPLPTPTQTPTAGPTPTPTPLPADLALAKTGSPSSVISGSRVTYQLVVTNNGPGTSNGVFLTDPLPVGMTFFSCSTSQGTCVGPAVGSNGTVVANLGSIPNPGFALVTIVATVTAPAGTSLINTAVVSATTSDPTLGNNTDAETTSVAAAPAGADLSVVKVSSPSPVSTGTQLTYTIAVNNGGPDPATGVIVNDSIPSGTTFASCVSSQGFCSGPAPGTNGPVTANLGVMASGANATITLVVNVTAPAGSTLTNTAVASSAVTDPNPSNNSSTTMTSVVP